MSEFLTPRIGIHEYKAPRKNGDQQFEITSELIDEFTEMESHQFDCYDEFNRDKVIGMFGRHDTLAHFHDMFKKYYVSAIDYDGPHTMSADNVRNDLVPVVRNMLEHIKPIQERYFRHFKGGLYRLCNIARDSETQERMSYIRPSRENADTGYVPKRCFSKELPAMETIFRVLPKSAILTS